MSELEASIQDLISRYLASEIDAAELNDRLPHGWDLDEAGEAAATDLGIAALGYLAGYQSGDRDEDELRERLFSLMSTVRVEYPSEELWSVLLWTRITETAELASRADTPPLEGFEQEASQHPQTKRRTTTALLDPPQSH